MRTFIVIAIGVLLASVAQADVLNVTLTSIPNAAICQEYLPNGTCKTWYTNTMTLPEFNSMLEKFRSLDQANAFYNAQILNLEARVQKLEQQLNMQQNPKPDTVENGISSSTSHEEVTE